MSEAKTKTSTQPLWFLGPGAIPVRANSKKIPAMVTHMAHEGDEVWTPIGQPGTNEDTAPGDPR